MVMTGGFATGFVLVVFFAVLVVIVGVAGLIWKVGAAIVRGLSRSAPASGAQTRYNVCPAPHCRFANRPNARYCAQCGERIHGQSVS